MTFEKSDGAKNLNLALLTKALKKYTEAAPGITHYQKYKLTNNKDIITDVIEAICATLRWSQTISWISLQLADESILSDFGYCKVLWDDMNCDNFNRIKAIEGANYGAYTRRTIQNLHKRHAWNI